MRVTRKEERLLPEQKSSGPYTPDQYIIDLAPNHYNFPVDKATFDYVKVGKNYELLFLEQEAKEVE